MAISTERKRNIPLHQKDNNLLWIQGTPQTSSKS